MDKKLYPGDMYYGSKLWEIDDIPIYMDKLKDGKVFRQISLRLSNTKKVPHYLTFYKGIGNTTDLDKPECLDVKFCRISLYKPLYLPFPDFNYKLTKRDKIYFNKIVNKEWERIIYRVIERSIFNEVDQSIINNILSNITTKLQSPPNYLEL